MTVTRKGQTMDVDVTQLPAQAVPVEAMSDEPVEDPQVGDLVVVYSRGSNRLAQVTKLGPKRVEVVYTTKGAWGTAQKIHEALSAPGYVQRHVEWMRRNAASNYDHYVRESNPETAVYAVKSGYKSEEKAAEERAEAAAKVEGLTKEQYVEQEAEKERVREQANHDEAVEKGVPGFVHVTTKSVPRTHVFALKEER